MATTSAPGAPRQAPLAFVSAWRGHLGALLAWWRADGEFTDDVGPSFAPSGRALAYRCATVPVRSARAR
ncbi:MAG: hypothetical protein U0Q15_02165 [Kineosporiaceae bacterium]